MTAWRVSIRPVSEGLAHFPYLQLAEETPFMPN